MELKHEPTKELNIAIGKSRHSAKWRNTTITWGELVEKLKIQHAQKKPTRST